MEDSPDRKVAIAFDDYFSRQVFVDDRSQNEYETGRKNLRHLKESRLQILPENETVKNHTGIKKRINRGLREARIFAFVRAAIPVCD